MQRSHVNKSLRPAITEGLFSLNRGSAQVFVGLDHFTNFTSTSQECLEFSAVFWVAECQHADMFVLLRLSRRVSLCFRHFRSPVQGFSTFCSLTRSFPGEQSDVSSRFLHLKGKNGPFAAAAASSSSRSSLQLLDTRVLQSGKDWRLAPIFSSVTGNSGSSGC